MSPTPFKDLAANASPGPWRLASEACNGFWIERGGMDDFEIITNLLENERLIKRPLPNAHYLARLGPDVMMEVYDALEKLRDSHDSSRRTNDIAERALNLLDGKPKRT